MGRHSIWLFAAVSCLGVADLWCGWLSSALDEENSANATIPLACGACDSNVAAPVTLNGYFGCKKSLWVPQHSQCRWRCPHLHIWLCVFVGHPYNCNTTKLTGARFWGGMDNIYWYHQLACAWGPVIQGQRQQWYDGMFYDNVPYSVRREQSEMQSLGEAFDKDNKPETPPASGTGAHIINT